MNKRSECVRNINKRNDASKMALECTRLIKDSLDLINKYDWELKYSEYRLGCDTNDGQSFAQKQVAVWEQNGEGIIRNHKIWDVKERFNSSVNNAEDFIKSLSNKWKTLNELEKEELFELVAGLKNSQELKLVIDKINQ